MKKVALLIVVLVGVLYALPGEWMVYNTFNRVNVTKRHPINTKHLFVCRAGLGVLVYEDEKIVKAMQVIDGLQSDDVRDIEFDGQGNCWIATAKGLASWNTNGTLDKFPVGSGYLPDYVIHSLKYDSVKNRMLIGTGKGLAIFKGDFTRSPYVPNTADWESHLDHYAKSIVVSGDKIALVYAQTCLIQNSTGGWTSYEMLDGGSAQIELTVDKGGFIWASCATEIKRFNGQSWEVVVSDGDNKISMQVDRNNVLWAVEYSAIVTVDLNNGNKISRFPKSDYDWLTVGKWESLNLNHLGNILIGCEKAVAENTAGSPIKFFAKPATRLPITISANSLIVNQAGNFKFDLVSARGQVIKIADGFYPAGVYQLKPFFSSISISSGHYLLHIRTKQGDFCGKVIITK